MGKWLLLMVAAAVIGVSVWFQSAKDSNLAVRSEQSDYQAKVIARDIAASGYSQTLSEVKRELMEVTRERRDVRVNNGSYDAVVRENVYGDLDLQVDGSFGDVVHEVASNVIFAFPFPAAVSLSDDQVEVSGLGSSYRVSGEDARMPSRAEGRGFLGSVHGIMTDSTHEAALRSALIADRIVGAGGDRSVASGFDESYFEAIYEQAKPHTDRAIGIDASNDERRTVLRGIASQSDPSHPKVVRVGGDLTIDYPLHGYGLLMVEDGNLTVATNEFTWEGLVLVRKQFKDSVFVTLSNNARVYGGLAAYDVEAPEGETPGSTCSGEYTTQGQNKAKGCVPRVWAAFACDGKSVTANSSKDLSNVVLQFADGVHQKFDGLSGYSRTFAGTGSNSGKVIVNVWIKSGCNKSGDGPGYGEYLANPNPPEEGSGGATPASYLHVTLGGTSEIHYSPEAIGKLAREIDLIRDGLKIVPTRNEEVTRRAAE